MTQAIIIYTTRSCPYCRSAKDLLRRKNAAFEEVDVTSDPAGRAMMTQKAGGRSTVPQIFFGERHIGGCDDLYALDAAGGLDPLLTA